MIVVWIVIVVFDCKEKRGVRKDLRAVVRTITTMAIRIKEGSTKKEKY